jgi:hypothetical protein
MTQVINRTFQSEDQAMTAARELLSSGFPRDRLHLLVYRDGEAFRDDEILGELSSLGLTPDEARNGVASLRNGQALLTARMPDLGVQTAEILDRHEPLRAQDMPSIERPDSSRPDAYRHSDGAPLSHALHAKVLSDDPAPLSHALHVPVLSEDHGPKARRRGGLSDDPAPLSHLLHIPVLAGD